MKSKYPTALEVFERTARAQKERFDIGKRDELSNIYMRIQNAADKGLDHIEIPFSEIGNQPIAFLNIDGYTLTRINIPHSSEEGIRISWSNPKTAKRSVL